MLQKNDLVISKGAPVHLHLSLGLTKILNYFLHITNTSRQFGKMLRNTAAAVLTNDVNCAKRALP